MIEARVRNQAIEAVNLLDSSQATVLEKHIATACWWMLYTIGFEAGRDRVVHLKHVQESLSRAIDIAEREAGS